MPGQLRAAPQARSYARVNRKNEFEPMAPSTPGQIPDDEAWHRTIILPCDILDNRPSGNNEVEWETEFAHRIWGCELIQEAGILLRWVERSTRYAKTPNAVK